ncbi:hypothetical protein MKEN_00127500 [Mycena kentingensis (nom. inval.)]|nr:hypothetical protein MKEN_00127500 [Mycena kentingensis (nom. inval.)]
MAYFWGLPSHALPAMGDAEVHFQMPIPDPNDPASSGDVRVAIGARRCTKCGKMEDQQTKMMRCGGCHVLDYCSKECQKAHWKGPKGHKIDCKADNSLLNVTDLGPVFYADFVINNCLQKALIDVHELTTLPASRLTTEPFKICVDIGIEPVSPAHLTSLLAAFKTPGQPAPTASLSAAAAPQVYNIQKVDADFNGKRGSSSMASWRKTREALDGDPETRHWVLGYVGLHKAHSPTVFEWFLLPIQPDVLEAVRADSEGRKNKFDWESFKKAGLQKREKVVDTTMSNINLYLRCDAAKDNKLGLRTHLSTLDIQLFKDYALNKDGASSQDSNEVPSNMDPFFAVALFRRHIAREEIARRPRIEN